MGPEHQRASRSFRVWGWESHCAGAVLGACWPWDLLELSSASPRKPRGRTELDDGAGGCGMGKGPGAGESSRQHGEVSLL